MTFVTGPSDVPAPAGAKVMPVQTANEMLAAVQGAAPMDAAVFAAAVAVWHVANAGDSKSNKDGSGFPQLEFAENPDILATVAQMAKGRPELVIGFAAETDDVVAHAKAKRARKGCDWIVANDVSPQTGIMGGTENAITLISDKGAEAWPRMHKDAVATKLAQRIAEYLA